MAFLNAPGSPLVDGEHSVGFLIAGKSLHRRVPFEGTPELLGNAAEQQRAGCAMGGPSKTPCGGAGLGAELLGPNDPEDPGLPDVPNGACCW